MRILTRYILKEYVVPLVYCLSGFVGIYVLFELFGSFSRLMAAKLPFLTAVDYFCAYLSPFFEWLAPPALMLAAMYTMWNFCRHSELIAMLANGVTMSTVSRPILFVAALMGGVVFWVNECYVPKRAQWAQQMKACQFDSDRFGQSNQLMLPGDGRKWMAMRQLDAQAKHLEGVSVVVDGPEPGSIRQKIEADRADFLDGEWWLTVRKVTRGPGVSPTPALDALAFRCFPEFTERPEDFLLMNGDLKFLSIRSRLRYLERQRDVIDEKDRREQQYKVWSKVFVPLSCLIVTLFAIPAGITSGRQSVFRGILGTLALYFAYNGCLLGAMAVAYAGWLPPLVAALFPHVLFLAVGIHVFRRPR